MDLPNAYLRLMEQEFGVTIHAWTEIVQIIGEEENREQVRRHPGSLVLVNRGMDHWYARCGDRQYHGEKWELISLH